MRLAPGPFPPIPDAGVPVDPPPIGLAAWVANELRELPGLEDLLDSRVDPNNMFPDQLPDYGADQLHDYSEAVLGQLVAYDLEGQAAALDPLKVIVDESIIAAYEVIPGEAFIPVPAEFVPGGGAPPVVVANPMHVTLTNETRPGATDFAVGETYKVTAHITLVAGGGGYYAGVDVLMFPWCEDKPQASILIGTTDLYGNLDATGTFLPDQWGRWGATFYSRTPAGGMMAAETIYWGVSLVAGDPVPPLDPAMPDTRTPLNIGTVTVLPPVPSGITVELINITYPGDANFRADAFWTLTVTGAPNADVEIWGTYQGDPLHREVLGQTDANGVFVLDGQMDPIYIGAWVERYSVGGVDWEDSLTFAVTE